MAQKDVELRISATDNGASATAKKVSDALSRIATDAQKAGGQLGKTSEAFAKMGINLGALSDEAARFKSFSAVTANIDQLSTALKTNESAMQGAAQRAAEMARAYEGAQSGANKARGAYAAEKESLASNIRERKLLIEMIKAQEVAAAKAAAESKRLDDLSSTSKSLKWQYAPQATAAKQASAAEQQRLASLQSERAAISKTITEQRAALKGMQVDVSSAASAEGELARQAQRATQEFSKQKSLVQAQRSTLAEVTALGTPMTPSQIASGARANALMQADVASAANVQVDSSSQKAFLTQRIGSRAAWQEAQAEVRSLAQAMRESDAPTAAMAQALGEAQAKAKLAKTEFMALDESVRMTGRDTATFSQWSKGARSGASAAPATSALPALGAGAISPQAVRDIGDAAKGADAEAKKLSVSLLGAGHSARRSMGFFRDLRAEIITLMVAYRALNSLLNQVRTAITMQETMDSAKARLNVAFGGDPQEVGKQLDFIRYQAERLGVAFGSLSDAYSKFAMTAKTANFTSEATQKIFLSVAEAGRVAGLSTQQMNGTLVALEQMVSKGKIQAQELRLQLGNQLPGAFELVAKALTNGDTQKLNKMVDHGQLLATQENMTKIADALMQTFGPQLQNSLQLTSAQVGKLQNAAQQAQLAFAQGFLPQFREMVSAFTEFSKSQEGVHLFSQMGQAAAQFMSVLAELPRYFDLIKAGVAGFAAYKLTSLLTSAASAAMRLTTALIAVAKGEAAVEVGLGPIGWALAAITAAATLWVGYTDTATSDMAEHSRIMDHVREAYQKVAGDASKWAGAIEKGTKLAATADLSKVSQAYSKAFAPADTVMSGASLMVDRARSPLTGPSYTREVNAARGPELLRGAGQIYDLYQQLKAGSIAIHDFDNKLGDIFNTTSSKDVKDLAIGLRQVVDNASAGGQSISSLKRAMEEAQGVIDLANGKTEKAKTEIYGLSVATNEAASNTKKWSDQFNSSMAIIDKAMPNFNKAAKDAENYTNALSAAMDALIAARQLGDPSKIAQAQAAMSGVSEGNAIKTFGGLGQSSAAALIMAREGFTGTAKWDTNHYRMGYGSDTYTDVNGIAQPVKQGMTTTADAAITDLSRRINLIFDQISTEIGSARFAAMSPNQQAALSSVAYNYGDLRATGPTAFKAFQYGSMGDISNAIRGLATDNQGINSDRRMQEASLFDTPGATTPAQLKTQQQLNDETNKTIDNLRQQIKDQSLVNEGKQRELAIQKAIDDARKKNPNITSAQVNTIGQQTGTLYDQQNSMAQVDSLASLRKELLAAQKTAKGSGDLGALANAKAGLKELQPELDAAIAKAKAMWEAIGGPKAAVAIAKLDALKLSLHQSDTQFNAFHLSTKTWQSAFNTGINGIVNSFGSFIQAIENGGNAFQAFGRTALKALSDVLLSIGEAILKYQILAAIRSAAGDASTLGNFAKLAMTAMTGHTGGLVGSNAIGGGNTVGSGGPAWMHGAIKYHTGGIAGLGPNEVSATLKKGEEVLTQTDPRHRFNVGGNTGAASGTKLTQVLAIGDREIANAMGAKAGEQVTLTHLKRNASTVRQILGLA